MPVARKMRLDRSGLGVLLLSATLLATAAAVALAGGATSTVRASPRRARTRARATSSAPASKRLFRIAGCQDSAPPRAYRGGSGRRREVAFGFDDGPAPDTIAFVRMLERVHARATFFVIGRQIVPAYRPALLRELRDGDVLGDHTFTHPDLVLSRDARSQLADTAAAIRARTGYEPCVFRPPYGAYDAAVVATARSLGMATVLWDVDPADWAKPGTAAIEQRVLAQVRPGSIVISHDGGGPRGQTLAAYPAIVHALRARGYRIVTIPELLGLRPVYVPCVRLCDGLGVPRSELPHGALLRKAP
jgi:peptidoglycan/xylan/chitin deacetylase (PgdA/CDA1 family)